MAAVVFGALSGALFGLLAVLVRRGLQRGGDPRAGSLVVAGVATLTLLLPAIVSGAIDGVPLRDLWPFLLAGALVPGFSQILFMLSVRDAGPSRAAILIGTAPLISVALAIALLDEPAEPLLLVGTLLVVAGGAVLARERVRPEHFRAIGVAFALSCAALFAVRDNVVRWASRDTHPPPLVTAAIAMLAATAFLVGYLAATRAPIRGRLAPGGASVLAGGRRARRRLRMHLRGVRPRPRLDRRAAERDAVALGSRTLGPDPRPSGRRDRPPPPRRGSAHRRRRRLHRRSALTAAAAGRLCYGRAPGTSSPPCQVQPHLPFFEFPEPALDEGLALGVAVAAAAVADPELGELRAEAAGGEGRAVVAAEDELAGLDPVHGGGLVDERRSLRRRGSGARAARRRSRGCSSR